jgi:hypothetical protein
MSKPKVSTKKKLKDEIAKVVRQGMSTTEIFEAYKNKLKK